MASYKRRRKPKNRFPWFLMVILVVGGSLFYLQQNSQVGSQVQVNLDNPPVHMSIDGDVWWDNNYAYRRPLQFDRGSGDLAKATLNHQALVIAKQSKADAADLRVIAQIADATDEVPILIASANTTETALTFDISKYPNANYYLYFGNHAPVTRQVLGIASNTKTVTTATLGDMGLPALRIGTTRFWQLIREDQTKLDLDIKIGFAMGEEPEYQLYYSLNNTAPKTVDSQSADSRVTLTMTDVKPGINQLFLLIVHNQQVYRSNTVQFNASKPMFVAWTIDWEGYNVKDPVLTAIESISTKYSAPLTQFFNPRIYIDAGIPAYRRNELTNWVKNRHSTKGDEIAMHMHMQYDMIRAAGVEPATSPRWGSGIDGYDVLTSSYDYPQFLKILDWALSQFEKNGLPKPSGYRAGGWFADLDILKALNDKGFTYDGSGREKYEFGRKKQPGMWDLTPTTQPYHPSTTNQNASTPSPVFDLWEIPNNGNDSYWFDTKHLTDRFYLNYTPGQALTEPKVVTYLSHPDWFDVDQPKLEALFTEISKYTLLNDAGPVIFTTVGEALKEWQ